jgi:pyridoxamine 5'-phosphate oxidase
MTNPEFHLNQIRTDYQKGILLESETGDDPVVFFEKWLQEAIEAPITEVNAMMLSSIDKENKPHSRVVLLKGIEDHAFQFFTNYNSAKGLEIEAHSDVCALFFWKELERQVRIEGKAQKVSPEVSDQYFYSRPLGSRISAIASPQSQVIVNRNVLEGKVKELETADEENIVRPEHWGGYQIIPEYIEFWQGRHSRLHDRIAFKKNKLGQWEKYRLAP